MHHLRLTHPDLDFWIDVRVREFDGRWLWRRLGDQPRGDQRATPRGR
jgi:hypothetical protein